MNIFHGVDSKRLGMGLELLGSIEGEVAEGVGLFWNHASRVLDGSGVGLSDLPPEYVSLKRNFFSGLFLYSYMLAGIPRPRRVVYAAMNHCLRGMVTGCDNLLDDEYKPTLLTDIPLTGVRFRSVLDIMAADRVLINLLLAEMRADPERVLAAVKTSLAALARSGVQEASEEAGVAGEPLRPEAILSEVHHFKTGILFQSPWSIPSLFEDATTPMARRLKEGLYRIGLGCQVLDDLVDLGSDMARRRHNYVASLAWHGDAPEERRRIAEANTATGTSKSISSALELPRAADAAANTANDLLHEGLGMLFDGDRAFMIAPITQYLAELIRADGFLTAEIIAKPRREAVCRECDSAGELNP